MGYFTISRETLPVACGAVVGHLVRCNAVARGGLVKNVSPIISIQQPMNNGVGVYLFTWAVTNTVATTA